MYIVYIHTHTNTHFKFGEAMKTDANLKISLRTRK